jgi:hypothetical protein
MEEGSSIHYPPSAISKPSAGEGEVRRSQTRGYRAGWREVGVQSGGRRLGRPPQGFPDEGQ